VSSTAPNARWLRVQSLFSAAIDCDPAERDALLARECRDDTDLGREVKSLLAAHESSGLMDQLASQISAPSLWRARVDEMDWHGRSVAQYFVIEPLAAGAMGLVYRARDERLGRHVALKFLPSHLSTQTQAQQRFLLEARAAAALDHPNICTIHEIGTTSDGQQFIAMPLYEGETLQARLERGPLSLREALDIALQVAAGLAKAHEHSVVHRDVKPSNVMLLPDGAVKVLDFGVARVADVLLTSPGGGIVGTVAYMSPEQGRGETTDARTDVWSLGVVLYEMLAGTRPFRGDNAQGLLASVMSTPPAPLSQHRADLPVEIDHIVAKALAKDPRHRYPSMSAMAAELERLTAWEGAPPKQPAPHGERRRAAVLVSVVADYSTLIERLDPSAFHALIGRIRGIAEDVVRKHGGVLNQSIEDEIVSLFGVPASHEDDVLRAVRASLELHARVLAIDADVPGGAMVLRSGVHAGPLVAQRSNDGQRRYGVSGAPAQVAARLASIAPRDAILLSPECQRIVAPFVNTSPCQAVLLQADAEAVTPYRLTGESGLQTRLEAAARKGLTPYAGRHAELAMLEAHFAQARAGHGQLVLVVGDAGLGKSRLLHELRLRVDAPDTRILQGRCRSYGGLALYSPFVETLRELLRLPLSEKRSICADEVVVRICGISPALEPFAPLYLHLLSMTSDAYPLPQHLRGEPLQSAMGEALTALLATVAGMAPTLLLLEDWHWSDEGSRETLRQLAEVAGAHALLIVVTSRPQLAGQDGPWNAARIPLAPLDLAGSVEIMRGVLHVPRVSAELALRVHERTGGNPFFLEETCETLVEQHLVTVRDGEGVAAGGVATLALPDTVQAVIRARLDSLDRESVEVLRIASVIGREFAHKLLVDVVGEGVDLNAALDRLKMAGLLQQSGFGAEATYHFKHVLTHEVTYDSLLGHQRRALHGTVGRAIERRYAQLVDEQADVLAHHFGCAEEWRAAIHHGRCAADRAIALSQFVDALDTLDRVREWLTRLPDQEHCPDLVADVLLQQERMCETLGQRGRQQELIGELVALLAPRGASERLAQAYLRQGDLLTLLQRFNEADRALSTSLRLGRERHDAALERHVLRSIGLLRWHEGRYAEALAITDSALEIDRERRDELAVAGDLANRGQILKSMGQFELARASLEEAIAIPAQAAEPATLTYNLHVLANIYRAQGDLDSALAYLKRADEISRRHLRPIVRAFHVLAIAHIHLQRGEVEQSLRAYEESVETSRRSRHADGLVQSLRAHGEVLFGLSRYVEALPPLQEAARLFAHLGNQAGEVDMLSSVAAIQEHTASPDAAAGTWEDVRRLCVQLADARGELVALEGIVRMRRRGGAARDSTVPYLDAALALALRLDDKPREASLRNTYGILEWESGAYTRALGHYERLLWIARQLADRKSEGLALNSLGVTLSRLNRHEEARTVLEESIALNERSGAQLLQAHALTALADVCEASGRRDAAADCRERSLALRREIAARE
jgi:serine/threonine protein kinase/tetratricopeptide (TPR) repeat protein